VVGEAVANVTQPTLLDILLNWVEGLFFRDLHFGIGPAGDFDDHVEDAIVLVSEEGDIVPWADGGLGHGRFEVGAMLWEVSDRAGMSRRFIDMLRIIEYREGGSTGHR